MSTNTNKRLDVYKVIEQVPGIHRSDIPRRANISDETVARHLGRMLHSGEVVGVQVRNYRGYMVRGGSELRAKLHLVRRWAMGPRVLVLILRGARTQHDLTKAGVPRSHSSTLLLALEGAGFVTVERQFRPVRIHLRISPQDIRRAYPELFAAGPGEHPSFDDVMNYRSQVPVAPGGA